MINSTQMPLVKLKGEKVIFLKKTWNKCMKKWFPNWNSQLNKGEKNKIDFLLWKNFSHFLFCFLTFLIASVSLFFVEAAYVKKIKGKTLLIIEEEEGELEEGQRWYVVNKKNKRKAVIQIKKVKKGKAIAYIKKGRVKKGWKLTSQKKSHSKGRSSLSKRKISSNQEILKRQKRIMRRGSKTFSLGLQGSLYSYTLNFKNVNSTAISDSADDQESLSLSGYAAGGEIPLIFHLSHWLEIQGYLGYSHVSLWSNQKGCLRNGEPYSCQTVIGYLMSGLWAKVVVPGLGFFRPWVGAGIDFYYPLSKNSQYRYLKEGSIKNAILTVFTGGFDLVINNIKIPLFFKYGLWPSSKKTNESNYTIQTHYMGISTGLLF